METEFVWRGHIYVYQCSFLPVRSQNMSLNLGGLNLSSIFLNGWVTHFCVKISKCSLLMYTALLKILWNAIYCWSEYIYLYMNCSGIDHKNAYVLSEFNTGGWYRKWLSQYTVLTWLYLCYIISISIYKACLLFKEGNMEIALEIQINWLCRRLFVRHIYWLWFYDEYGGAEKGHSTYYAYLCNIFL